MFDTGRTVTVGDATLFVAEAGRSDGTPIVLLHGGLRSRRDFEPLAEYLAKDFRLVAIDSRGHGRSTIGDVPMTYHQLAEDVTSVLGQLGLDEAGIIGHSDGAIVALRLASSGAIKPRFVVAVAARWRLSDTDPIRDICRGMTADTWRGMFTSQVQCYETENPAPDFDRLYNATTAMWLDDGDKSYPGASISSISSPLLVVHGDDDALVSRALAFELADQVDGSRMLNLPFSSHTLLEDTPTDVLPALTKFIQGAPKTIPGNG